MGQPATQELMKGPHAVFIGVDLDTGYPLVSGAKCKSSFIRQWWYRIGLGSLSRRPRPEPGYPGLVSMYLSLSFFKGVRHHLSQNVLREGCFISVRVFNQCKTCLLVTRFFFGGFDMLSWSLYLLVPYPAPIDGPSHPPTEAPFLLTLIFKIYS